MPPDPNLMHRHRLPRSLGVDPRILPTCGGAITGIGFLAVALSRRQLVLGVAAVAFGLVMGLEEPFHALSNGLTNNYPHMPGVTFIDHYGSSMIGAALGVVLFAMGVLALHSERSR